MYNIVNILNNCDEERAMTISISNMKFYKNILVKNKTISYSNSFYANIKNL